jgi:hypothetical protein
MRSHTLSHFNKVAQAMNKYVAASAHHARAGRHRLQMRPYQPWFHPPASLGNRFPGGMYPMGNNYFNNGFQMF